MVSLSNLGALAIENAQWIMLGALVLFVARLTGYIQRSANEERAR